jgi:hypothetical protein
MAMSWGFHADLSSYPWQDAVTLQYPATALNPKAELTQVSGGLPKFSMRMNQKL